MSAEAKQLNGRERALLREQGYSDGRAGRERTSTNAEYLTSFRRGSEARAKEAKR